MTGWVAGWPGRMAGWLVAGWPGGRVAGWPDGRVSGWPDGRMAGWPGGRVAGWPGGRVAGRIKSRLCLITRGAPSCKGLLDVLVPMYPLGNPYMRRVFLGYNPQESLDGGGAGMTFFSAKRG